MVASLPASDSLRRQVSSSRRSRRAVAEDGHREDEDRHDHGGERHTPRSPGPSVVTCRLTGASRPIPAAPGTTARRARRGSFALRNARRTRPTSQAGVGGAGCARSGLARWISRTTPRERTATTSRRGRARRATRRSPRCSQSTPTRRVCGAENVARSSPLAGERCEIDVCAGRSCFARIYVHPDVQSPWPLHGEACASASDPVDLGATFALDSP